RGGVDRLSSLSAIFHRRPVEPVDLVQLEAVAGQLLAEELPRPYCIETRRRQKPCDLGSPVPGLRSGRMAETESLGARNRGRIELHAQNLHRLERYPPKGERVLFPCALPPFVLRRQHRLPVAALCRMHRLVQELERACVVRNGLLDGFELRTPKKPAVFPF